MQRKATARGELTGPIYAHTGVITSAGGGWRYVKSAWGVADTNVLMTSLGNNLYSISFVPRTYYNVPSSEVILQLAFLFRNVNGSIVTRNSDGSDIFIDLKDSTHINCAIVDPVAANNSTLLVNPGQSISITGIADTIAGLSFLLNGSAIASVTDDTLTSSFTPSSSGNNTLQLIASDGSTADTSEINFLLIPSTPIAAVPVGAKDGVTYLNDSTVIFNLFAPHKEFVYLLGDFNNWTIDPAYLMNRTPDTTRYWIQITGLQAQQEYVYQYLIDVTLKLQIPIQKKLLTHRTTEASAALLIRILLLIRPD
ncbi:MAG: hypothetical protein IPP51_00505 [Bacteroidetes bacterium]|nr:hypothetical protein [Bacteroidota bacterium]